MCKCCRNYLRVELCPKSTLDPWEQICQHRQNKDTDKDTDKDTEKYTDKDKDTGNDFFTCL